MGGGLLLIHSVVAGVRYKIIPSFQSCEASSGIQTSMHAWIPEVSLRTILE
jgi:hypothetical protein